MSASEISKRSITVVFITAFTVLFILFSDKAYLVSSVTALLSVCGCYELQKACLSKINPFHFAFAFLVSAGIAFVRIPYYVQILYIVFPVVVLYFLELMIHTSKHHLNNIWKTIFLEVIIIFLFQAIRELRFCSYGVFYLTFAILVSVFTDSFAYIWGKSLGKHKMVPKISPKKTWEGSIGGILSSIVLIFLISLLVLHFNNFSINFPKMFVLAFLTSVISEFGDLALSITKRICNIKDFGTILPGHGGILDRFDSHLFSIPFVLIFISTFFAFIY